MKYQNLKRRYRDLEMSVYSALREEINKSSQKSKHINDKAITVSVSKYTEMVIVDDRLTFLDSSGYHYSVYTCSLEDLIEILHRIW